MYYIRNFSGLNLVLLIKTRYFISVWKKEHFSGTSHIILYADEFFLKVEEKLRYGAARSDDVIYIRETVAPSSHTSEFAILGNVPEAPLKPWTITVK